MVIDVINNQNEIKTMLRNNYQNNHLSHAYIFNGEVGVGKKEMALYFAAMMYCKHDEICFECEDCHKIFNEEHLNVYIVKSEGQVIKKEQVLDLQKEFARTSLVDGPRIYIIEDADKLNVQSANSLLKFIEEPTNNNTYAILLTTNIEDILPTIISRCGIINFKSIDKNILVKTLNNQGITENAKLICEFTNNIESAIMLSKDDNFIKTVGLCEEFIKIKDSKSSIIYLQKNINFFDNVDNLKLYLEMLSLIYEGLLKKDMSNFPKIEKDLIEIQERKSNNKIIKELELILELRKKLNSNMSSKNIIINLFVNLY